MSAPLLLRAGFGALCIMTVISLEACYRCDTSLPEPNKTEPQAPGTWEPEWVKNPDIPGFPEGWLMVAPATHDPLWDKCLARATSGIWRIEHEQGIRLIPWEPSSDLDAFPVDLFSKLPISEVGYTPRVEWVRVIGGFVVGIDQGESGAGLWWISVDGNRSKRLLDFPCHPRKIEILNGRLTVFCGGAAGLWAPGKIIELFPSGESQDGYKIGVAAQLEASIDAVGSSIPYPEARIVLSGNKVLKWQDSSLTQLVSFNYKALDPTSLVQIDETLLLLAGRHAAVALSDFVSGSGTVSWYVPSDCVVVQEVEGTANCQCRPLTGPLF